MLARRASSRPTIDGQCGGGAQRGWRPDRHAAGRPRRPLLRLRCGPGARESMPGCATRCSTLIGSATGRCSAWRPPGNERVRPGTPTAGSCICNATSCAACPPSGSRPNQRAEERRGVTLDTDSTPQHSRASSNTFKCLYYASIPERLPPGPARPARRGIRGGLRLVAVDRAVPLPPLNSIRRWGTAVNVQQMVFGNNGQTSGSVVASSVTSERAPEPSGDSSSTPRARTSSAGVRNPRTIAELADVDAARTRSSLDPAHAGAHYGDMQGKKPQTEFTIGRAPLHAPLGTAIASRPRCLS